MLIALIFCSCGCLHLHMNSKSKASNLSESYARTLISKYQPVFYFHSSEGYFPTKIEDFKIDWTKADLTTKDTYVDTNGFKGNTALAQSQPLYVSIIQNDDGSIRISYMVLYAWNDKGPYLRIYGKLASLGVDKSVTVGNYGLGVHYSDVEHVSVYLKSDGSFDYAYYAYHSWGTDSGDKKYAKDLSWDGTHPIVYVALGSHASYTSADDHAYKSLWDEQGSKVLGVRTYKTYAKLTDKTSKGSKWYSTNVRLLKLNGNAMSGISNDENYLGFKYSGRLGKTYDNTNWNGLETYSGFSSIKSAVKVFSKSAANDMQDGMDELRDTLEAECVASGSFYTRSFW